MRDIGKNQLSIKIEDPATDDVHELYYRQPTVKERNAYEASRFVRRKNKLINKSFETRLKFGLRILTGFKKGTFGINGKPFSSDPQDGDYREDWKALLQKGAPEIVAKLGQKVFESMDLDTVETAGVDELEDMEGEAPLEQG